MKSSNRNFLCQDGEPLQTRGRKTTLMYNDFAVRCLLRGIQKTNRFDKNTFQEAWVNWSLSNALVKRNFYCTEMKVRDPPSSPVDNIFKDVERISSENNERTDNEVTRL